MSLLRHVFAAADSFARLEADADPTPLTLLALGGYGRGELNPGSDVDVMFLHADSREEVSPYAKQVVEQVLYLLWDIGFKVGHSTRSLEEAIAQANRDTLTKTALLEARFLAGDADLKRHFRERFRAECVAGREREYIEARMQDQVARHAKFGNSVYMQEPHVKSGCGGLRDYQNLLWMAAFKDGALTTNLLVGKNWLSAGDRGRIETAYDFLLRLRTDLHYANGRASDVLHLNAQEQIARRLGYPQTNSALLSEALMKDYYRHARNIFRVTSGSPKRSRGQLCERPGPLAGLPRSVSGGPRPIRQPQWPTLREGERSPGTRALAAMRGFRVAQLATTGTEPGARGFPRAQAGAHQADISLRDRPAGNFQPHPFRKGEAGRILRMMHRGRFPRALHAGVWSPHLPGAARVFPSLHRGRAHAGLPRKARCARRPPRSRSCRTTARSFEKLEDPLVLYLALLLHDTGKAVGARPHSEASAMFAQRAASRLQFTSAQRKSLILLVDHHITLSNIAQQRNLDDPETAVEFARLVRDQDNLDALMLLTLADGQGTSAEAWSDWKESLVWQLYHATSQYLSDQAAFYEARKIERELPARGGRDRAFARLRGGDRCAFRVHAG